MALPLSVFEAISINIANNKEHFGAARSHLSECGQTKSLESSAGHYYNTIVMEWECSNRMAIMKQS